MNQKFVFAALIFLGMTNCAQAQIYKCKQPDGSTSYSDQPCAESSSPSPALGASSAARSSHSKGREIAQGFNERWADQRAKGDKPLRDCNNGNVSACKEYQRTRDEYFQASRGDFEKTVNSFTSAQFRACQAGNRKACEESECSTMEAAGRGGPWDSRPAEDFKTCARGLGFPFGNYWAIASGKLDSTSVGDSSYLNKLEHGTQWKNALALTCFRKRATSSSFKGSVHRIAEIVTISKEGTKASRTFSYAPQEGQFSFEVSKGESSNSQKTLEELADRLCER